MLGPNKRQTFTTDEGFDTQKAEFGRQVKAAREAANLRQTQLAELLNYDRSTISNLETGNQVSRPVYERARQHFPELPTIDHFERAGNRTSGRSAATSSVWHRLRGARSGDAWVEIAHERVLDPLVLASARPWQTIWDMTYRVRLVPEVAITFNDGQRSVNRISVDSKSRRWLAYPDTPERHYWLTLAENQSAYEGEFHDAGCLGREFLPIAGLSGEAWQEAVMEMCGANLRVSGMDVELEFAVDPASPGMVMYRTVEPISAAPEWQDVHIRFDYVEQSFQRNFSVTFASYYCLGTTDISLELDDFRREWNLGCEEFVATSLDARATRVRPRSTDRSKLVSFEMGPNSFLWPGSGIRFHWHRLADESR